MPSGLRAQLEADYAPVRPLPSPWLRALWVAPFGLVALLAAPTYFNVRADAAALGWPGSWGASLLQAAIGLALVAAALREAIPGRAWGAAPLAAWIAMPIAGVIVLTMASWEASPVLLRGRWWVVAGLCFAGSAATAMPVVALAGILAARAYPTRPVIAGALLGLGAGLMADAGWRMFCHFTEPGHVLSAHLGAVVLAAVAGSLLASAICRAPRRS